MKRLIVLICLSLFIIGCATPNQKTEMCKRGVTWQSLDHAAFSMWGYDNCSGDDKKTAIEQGWWGDLVSCPVETAKK
jgi:hypothetical protein